MELSVVIPVHDEAPVLAELARRARAAALRCAVSAEVLLVDDASGDDTAALAPMLTDEVVRFLRLTTQHGQSGATRAGLAVAEGAITVVLDGDLQDPPEAIIALVAALRARHDCDAAFAVKSAREASPAARVVFGAYHLVQRVFGDGATPPGAGSYCAFRASVRDALLRAPPSRANLAVLLGQQRLRYVTVGYDKCERVAGDSRVGALGLVREAVDSLAATGALSRMALALGALSTAAAMGRSRWRAEAVAGLTVATLVAYRLARGHERHVACGAEAS